MWSPQGELEFGDVSKPPPWIILTIWSLPADRIPPNSKTFPTNNPNHSIDGILVFERWMQQKSALHLQKWWILDGWYSGIIQSSSGRWTDQWPISTIYGRHTYNLIIEDIHTPSLGPHNDRFTNGLQLGHENIYYGHQLCRGQRLDGYLI